MLFSLTQYLQDFHSGFNVFNYLTLRGILGVLTALSISLIIGPSMIIISVRQYVMMDQKHT